MAQKFHEPFLATSVRHAVVFSIFYPRPFISNQGKKKITVSLERKICIGQEQKVNLEWRHDGDR